MALTVDTQDLDNYPGIVKQITIDNEKIIPLGYDGDEKFSISYTTSAYSDNDNLTTIQDVYTTDLKVGWFKSSGFAGSSGKFALSSTVNSFKLKLDSTVSGTDGSGYYTIVLDYNANNIPVRGELIADDMESKIRNLSLVTGDAGYALAYANATVVYVDNKFWVFSGTMGKEYTGEFKTSVDIQPGATNDCTTILGFNLGWASESLAVLTPLESPVTQSYTVGDTTLYIQPGTAFAAGECMLITDNTNKDYFVVVSGTNDTMVTVTASGAVGSITHNYTANASKIQVLREQDPEGEPKMYYDSIDKINRHGVEQVMAQIDYSS